MASNRSTVHPLLANIAKLVPGLAQVLGNAEVVLHELSHPEDSVIAIAGNITDRKIGAPLTDLVLQVLRQGKTEKDLINYPSRTAEGKLLRSSTLFIRDEEGNVIGCLCINFDITKWMVAKHLVDEYCRTVPLDDMDSETFISDVEVMLRSNIEEVIQKTGVPVPMMKKEDKVKAVKALDERGIFQIKRAVDIAARSLHVSRYTIYNYLDETRNSKDDESSSNRERHG